MAQNNLGVLYQNGDGILKDYKTAIELFEKSAEQGFALALMNLLLEYS